MKTKTAHVAIVVLCACVAIGLPSCATGPVSCDGKIDIRRLTALLPARGEVVVSVWGDRIDWEDPLFRYMYSAIEEETGETFAPFSLDIRKDVHALVTELDFREGEDDPAWIVIANIVYDRDAFREALRTSDADIRPTLEENGLTLYESDEDDIGLALLGESVMVIGTDDMISQFRASLNGSGGAESKAAQREIADALERTDPDAFLAAHVRSLGTIVTMFDDNKTRKNPLAAFVTNDDAAVLSFSCVDGLFDGRLSIRIDEPERVSGLVGIFNFMLLALDNQNDIDASTARLLRKLIVGETEKSVRLSFLSDTNTLLSTIKRSIEGKTGQ